MAMAMSPPGFPLAVDDMEVTVDAEPPADDDDFDITIDFDGDDNGAQNEDSMMDDTPEELADDPMQDTVGDAAEPEDGVMLDEDFIDEEIPDAHIQEASNIDQDENEIYLEDVEEVDEATVQAQPDGLAETVQDGHAIAGHGHAVLDALDNNDHFEGIDEYAVVQGGAGESHSNPTVPDGELSNEVKAADYDDTNDIPPSQAQDAGVRDAAAAPSNHSPATVPIEPSGEVQVNAELLQSEKTRDETYDPTDDQYSVEYHENEDHHLDATNENAHETFTEQTHEQDSAKNTHEAPYDDPTMHPAENPAFDTEASPTQVATGSHTDAHTLAEAGTFTDEKPHPAIISFEGTEMTLFSGDESDEANISILDDCALAYGPINDLLEACKRALVADGTEHKYLIFDIPDLQLSISEVSSEARHTSLQGISDIHERLWLNDGHADVPVLRINATLRSDCSARLAELESIVAQGKGYSHLYPVDDDDDGDENVAAEDLHEETTIDKEARSVVDSGVLDNEGAVGEPDLPQGQEAVNGEEQNSAGDDGAATLDESTMTKPDAESATLVAAPVVSEHDATSHNEQAPRIEDSLDDEIANESEGVQDAQVDQNDEADELVDWDDDQEDANKEADSENFDDLLDYPEDDLETPAPPPHLEHSETPSRKRSHNQASSITDDIETSPEQKKRRAS